VNREDQGEVWRNAAVDEAAVLLGKPSLCLLFSETTIKP
jgi:hypothetical protein